jgi:alanyl-tRNA synthetase
LLININSVTIIFYRRTDGSLEALSKVHVDTGMGLERMLAVMYQTSSTYNTDLFIPTFTAIQKVHHLYMLLICCLLYK